VHALRLLRGILPPFLPEGDLNRMTCGRMIGIDLGLRRVGVSISDERGLFAYPLAVLPYTGSGKVIEELVALAKTHGAIGFVVGLPKNMDGTLGESARRCLRFSKKLQAKSGLEVVLVDERLTTSQAEKEMIGLGVSRRRRRLTLDQAASVLILENYLRYVRNTPGARGEKTPEPENERS